jgi:hypothetical protein
MKILTGIAIGIIVSLSFPAEAQKMAPSQEQQIADPKFDRNDRYEGQYCAGAGDVDFLRPEKI